MNPFALEGFMQTKRSALSVMVLCWVGLSWMAVLVRGEEGRVDAAKLSKWQVTVGFSPMQGVPSLPEATGYVAIRTAKAAGAAADHLVDVVLDIEAAEPVVKALPGSFLVLPARIFVRQRGQTDLVSLEITMRDTRNEGSRASNTETTWMAAESSLALLVALDVIPFRYEDVSGKFGLVRKGCCRLDEIRVTSSASTTRLGPDDFLRRWGYKQGNWCLVWSYPPYVTDPRVFSCRPPFTATNSMMSRVVTRSGGDLDNPQSASIVHTVKRSSFEGTEGPFPGQPVIRLVRPAEQK